MTNNQNKDTDSSGYPNNNGEATGNGGGGYQTKFPKKRIIWKVQAVKDETNANGGTKLNDVGNTNTGKESTQT